MHKQTNKSGTQTEEEEEEEEHQQQQQKFWVCKTVSANMLKSGINPLLQGR
jgi:hypothetical protein